MILNFKYRVKDSTVGKYLDRHAFAVNQVWNYCCQIQREAESRWKAGRACKWPTAIDLNCLCIGVAAELGIHSDTVNLVCRQFAVSRNRIKRHPRFRASFGPKRSLGWVPFILKAIKIGEDYLVYLKRKFRFWKSRDIGGPVKVGSFSQDARGRWYVSFSCEVDDTLPTGEGSVGIDLGLKTLATCSDGTTVPALKHYRKYQAALGVAQRANNSSRVKAIHAKIANTRRHHLHEQSSKIARENGLIVVGNVNAASLAKTRMAKSVFDASWSMFRNMLEYKARRHRANFVVADERWTSQTCSECQAIGGPKGIAGLAVRHWNCPSCGKSHDRDVNAARNILRAGRERAPLVGGIPSIRGLEDVTTRVFIRDNTKAIAVERAAGLGRGK